jgi:hypothetical protein
METACRTFEQSIFTALNLSTIVYLGEPEQGNGRTVRQFLQNMEDGDNPAFWAYYIYSGIERERSGGKIDLPDETQMIVERIDEIMQKKAGAKEVFVGSLDNQQAGLVPPDKLCNYIFREKEDLKLKLMWEWIRDHFLPAHKYDYDWFALLRYLADNNKLERGMETSNALFAKQMKDWFPSYKCKSYDVKLYRTGYLGNTPYRIWNKANFLQQKGSNQKVEGFIHLNNIINRNLAY